MTERLWRGVSDGIRGVLERSLEGRSLEAEDATTLLGAKGPEVRALAWVADVLRQQQAGDAVTYVINRNINFTNVCVMACKFCAFSRDLRDQRDGDGDAYELSIEEVVRRAVQAQDLGATEVCLQAGLTPSVSGQHYVQMLRAVKTAAPDLHVHAFSPEEVRYGARLAKRTIPDFLAELRDAGLGSLPGTSAEILDDTLRTQIAPGRISTAQWCEVIRTAHGLGLRTTATMMYGHLETPKHIANHLVLLRQIQRETGGFTEFVPLSFVHHEAPLFVKPPRPGVQPGPTGDAVVRMHAVARLMLGADFTHIQASWVKDGLRLAQRLLHAGCDDLGGTLMNESISTAAGAPHGQRVTPAMLRHVITDAGRQPVQRTTLYQPVPEAQRVDRLSQLRPAEAARRLA